MYHLWDTVHNVQVGEDTFDSLAEASDAHGFLQFLNELHGSPNEPDTLIIVDIDGNEVTPLSANELVEAL